jgi:hypothetical protein
LAKLFHHDDEESRKMFDCCRSTGIFLPHLEDNEIGEALIHNIDALLDLAKQTMNLPIEERMNFGVQPPERLFE